MNNDADIIVLISPEGLTVHAIAYDLSWYHNDIKSDGGWTIEMIDTKNPCAGVDNWKASTDQKGGTPCQKNAVDGIYADETFPNLQRTYTIDSVTIVAVFDKTIDSLSASIASNYSPDNNLGNPVAATPQPPLFNEVILKLAKKLLPKTVYSLSANHITDCAGNTISSSIVKAGFPVLCDTNDIVINEILFNPKPNGYDYVEFYNRSEKVFDLQHLYVATRDAGNSLKSIMALNQRHFLLFPNEYYVITQNSLSIKQNYLVKNPDELIQLSSLPSFSDDEGICVLLNENQTVIDELHYNHNWQLALITNEDGVALERIDYNKATQDPNNWTSAASTAGFGTPTYQNSQFMISQQLNSEINISPRVFSPDNDGYEDFCFINYRVENSGFLATINIYEASGRPVRNITNNATLALTGGFKWDGLDDKQQRLPIGIYIIVTQIFDLSGKTKQFKNAVTLARRL